MARIKQPIGRKWTMALNVIGIVVLLASYELASYIQHEKNPNDTTVPNLRQLADGLTQVATPKTNSLKALYGIEEDTSFWGSLRRTPLFNDIIQTYIRLALGLLVGCLFSVVLGVQMGCREWIASLHSPVLALLAKIPGTAMLAVFFVLVHPMSNVFVAMISFGIIPTLTRAVYLAARDDVHAEEIDKAYTLGASNGEVVWEVVFPLILPRIIENIALQIGPAMVCLIAAEMLIADVGMGYQIRAQQHLLNMAIVYDYIIILGLSGLLLDKLMDLILRWTCPWYEKVK